MDWFGIASTILLVLGAVSLVIAVVGGVAAIIQYLRRAFGKREDPLSEIFPDTPLPGLPARYTRRYVARIMSALKFWSVAYVAAGLLGLVLVAVIPWLLRSLPLVVLYVFMAVYGAIYFVIGVKFTRWVTASFPLVEKWLVRWWRRRSLTRP